MSDQVYAWVVTEGTAKNGGRRVPLMSAVPVARVSKQIELVDGGDRRYFPSVTEARR